MIRFRLIRNVWREAFEDDLLDWAAVLAFYFLFSLFPAILFMAALSATLHLRQMIHIVLLTLSFDLPRPAGQLVDSGVLDILHRHVPGLISVGIVLLMYSAAQGFMALMRALNVIYEVRETRPYWRLLLIAFGLTWSSGLLAAFALGAVLLGRRIAMALFGRSELMGPLALLAPTVRWITTLAFMIVALVVVYRVAPNVRIKGAHTWPAAVIALALWVVATGGLAAYVARFAPYGSLYGSLGAVIGLMLWFYIVAFCILLGAEIHDEWLKLRCMEVVPKAPDRRMATTARRSTDRAA